MTTFSHRQSAVSGFNEVWGLLHLKGRSKEEDEQMIHLAHTSFCIGEMFMNAIPLVGHTNVKA
jgi:hypothetical protein